MAAEVFLFNQIEEDSMWDLEKREYVGGVWGRDHLTLPRKKEVRLASVLYKWNRLFERRSYDRDSNKFKSRPLHLTGAFLFL